MENDQAKEVKTFDWCTNSLKLKDELEAFSLGFPRDAKLHFFICPSNRWNLRKVTAIYFYMTCRNLSFYCNHASFGATAAIISTRRNDCSPVASIPPSAPIEIRSPALERLAGPPVDVAVASAPDDRLSPISFGDLDPLDPLFLDAPIDESPLLIEDLATRPPSILPRALDVPEPATSDGVPFAGVSVHQKF
ncbi:hypothetical protein QAD02_013167 [Eretmocerus hayati]|uniref:Uncharacterized protein n=1 Tax=Eretmocerus hayati TaxID=131215 RepID=A0ACC2P1B9_9HYME|nr:hypothetical protein QAD02_013167 [Eretmocerus hayati]